MMTRLSKLAIFAQRLEEVERDLISERSKEGLAAARAKGRLLGRPKRSLGTSKLDGKEEEIRMLLEEEVSKASIAKIVDIFPDRPPPFHPHPKARADGLKWPIAGAASLERV